MRTLTPVNWWERKHIYIHSFLATICMTVEIDLDGERVRFVRSSVS